jgi:hypothetical protein
MADEDKPLTREEGQALWDSIVAENSPDHTAEDDSDESLEVVPEPEPEPDPWEGVPEVVRARLEAMERMEQRLRTSEGRVSALQRDLDLSKQAAKAAEDATGARQMESANASSEKWQAFQAELPEWAEAIDERLSVNKVKDSQPEIRAEIESLREYKVQTQRELAELRVSVVHPGWDETVKSPEFVEWINSQPPETRQLAESHDYHDAITLLNSFAEHPAQAEKAKKLLESRANRLKSSAVTPTRNQAPPPKSEDDLSPKEYWDALAKAKARERRMNQ